MNKNIIVIVCLSCLFSLVFIGVSEQQMKESAAIYNTSWLDAIKSMCIGIIGGIVLRFKTVRSYFERWPLGPDYQRHLLQYGSGAILLGFFGACIIYFKFGELEYARVPLHASILGLGLISLFLADTVSSKFVYFEKGA